MTTDAEVKTKDDVYDERNLLALALISLRYGAGMPCGWWLDEDDDEWAVVWTNLYYSQDTQVGWHVPVEMVPEWLPMADPEYDGYTTAEKNARLREFFSIAIEMEV